MSKNNLTNKTKFLILLFLLFFSIKPQAQNDTLTYVFFGHPYQGGANTWMVDFRIEAMDLTQFDGIWLGGDVASEAALDYSSVAHLDSLFDLGKSTNHWALGNHDTRNGNLEWIEEFTERPRFYAQSENGITVIVMDGNISPLDCENLNKQYKIIKEVCDTINSGHLIFLIHHGITSDVPNVPGPINYSHTEFTNWMPHCYNDTATYANTIYPMLVDVENRGVDVMHIMGDTGAWYKKFHGVSADGIDYFAAGLGNGYKITNGTPINAPDEALVFKHVLATNELFWEFVQINDL